MAGFDREGFQVLRFEYGLWTLSPVRDALEHHPKAFHRIH